MTKATGMYFKGVKVRAEENYGSIAGIKQWNDGREQVVLVNVGGVNRVNEWGDKSPMINTVSANGASRRPFYEKNCWVYSNDVAIYMSSLRRDYTFLHNGSKFGIYSIEKNTWSLANAVSSFGAVNFTNASGVGLQGILNSATNMGRSGFILRGGATTPVKQITNLLNPSNINYVPSDTIVIRHFVNFGQSLGLSMRYGPINLTTTPFFPTLAEYPQGQHLTFNVVTSVAGQVQRTGLLLIYDWTGKTDEECLGFHNRITQMLEADKIKFEQLDLL